MKNYEQLCPICAENRLNHDPECPMVRANQKAINVEKLLDGIVFGGRILVVIFALMGLILYYRAY